LAILPAASAEDWPEWRGKGRLGVWTETGVMERFPEAGLHASWRVPIHRGFSGPAVSDGRVYVVDFKASSRWQGKERALCIDEKSGKLLWTQEWDADYLGMQETYATGPRATPTVDGERVYVAGAKGALHCLNARTGAVIWSRDYVKDYGTQVPTWGIASAPLVDGERLLCIVGGEREAKVVAFDKMTGKEIWRALSSDGDLGVNQPIIVTAANTRQLIIWYPGAVASLDPAMNVKVPSPAPYARG
jgi:outer membrane protein assembly factor BamB